MVYTKIPRDELRIGKDNQTCEIMRRIRGEPLLVDLGTLPVLTYGEDTQT